MHSIILEYVLKEFGTTTTTRLKHYSYCLFPEEDCTCHDLSEISNDTPLINGGYIDSFSMMAVLVFLESTFNMKIPDSEATPTNFNTINKMVELVKKYQK